MRLIAKLEVSLNIFFGKYSPLSTFFANKVIALGEFCTEHENFVMDLSFLPNRTLKLCSPYFPINFPDINKQNIDLFVLF